MIKSLFIVVVAVCCASAQYHLNPKEYRSDNPSPSFEVEQVDERFIKTVSLTLSTTTTTTTSTATATCTTSTGALSVCTASGRRRRGLHLSGNKEGRGLFYNENEEDSEDGTIFLPSLIKEEGQSVKSEVEPIRETREAPAPIPFVVQPGFNAPAGQGRVLLFFGTSTVTTTTTTTTTTSLTAICRSTTGFQVCGSTGK
uniref:Uncharacterized protein n=1 Tax=Daphnia magna TaxID=35525 RepID=A0A0P5P656_9CRUS